MRLAHNPKNYEVEFKVRDLRDKFFLIDDFIDMELGVL